ncbi:MAG: GNAT family N-acetyltransferase [Pseudomonadota bacterium]
MAEVLFRPYDRQDRDRCVAIFDANSPEYFSPVERDDYLEFLDGSIDDYRVCEEGERVVGAFGLAATSASVSELNWILIDPETQGRGIGARMLERAIEECLRSGAATLRIAASHKSAPFFERFGARAVRTTEHGWGPDMHRVDMRLDIAAAR